MRNKLMGIAFSLAMVDLISYYQEKKNRNTKKTTLNNKKTVIKDKHINLYNAIDSKNI